MSDLKEKHCAPCNGTTPKLSVEQARELLKQVPGYELAPEATHITRRYQFKNYYETMAFVNAVAFIAHREDHHPELEVSYRTCIVKYNTHDVSGLSENDFICAAQVNALLA
jgi:4a-hydroxytetrahydrobiopterin dehydratase